MHSVLLMHWTNGPRMHRVLRRTARALEIGKGRLPNFCQDFGKASWQKNAQHVASALSVCSMTPRMLVCLWCVHSCVELRAHFWACSKNPTHTANDDECIALVQRWSSALDERVTNDDARLANDNALAQIANFQCAGRAPAMRPLCVTGPLHAPS